MSFTFQNGLLNALPFICLLLATFLFGFLSDTLKKKARLSPTFVCKMFYFGGKTTGRIWTDPCRSSIFSGSCLAAASVIGFSFMDCHHAGFAVAFLCLSYVMYAGLLCSYLTSLTSIAPCFSGMVHSICRFLGFFGDSFAPFVVAAVTKSVICNY